MIDSHIHLEQYDAAAIRRIVTQAEHVIAVSMDLASSQRTLLLAQQYANVHAAFGFHPEQELPSGHEQQALFEWMAQHAAQMIAVGEVGLPYYLQQQQALQLAPYEQLLERFCHFAKTYQKPINLHAVYEGAQRTAEIVDSYGLQRAHFHWAKGDTATMTRLFERGYYISITPDVLYEREIQQIVAYYPLTQLMVETDGPWQFEGPFAQQQTTPAMMRHSLQEIARLKQLSVAETMAIISTNSKRFYQL